MESERLRDRSSLRQVVFWFYLAVAMIVFAVVLLLRDRTKFYFKLLYPVPTWLFFLLGTGAASVCAVLFRRFGGKLEKLHPTLFFTLFFVLQLYISYNCYFKTGWDVDIIIPAAESLADGKSLESFNYYSIYVNNVFMTWLFSLFIRLYRAVGNLDVELSSYMAVIIVQCALSSCTGLLVYRAALRLWKSPRAAWAAALFYCVLVGFSPWKMIPYSDSMGLIVPMLALNLYLSMDNRRHLALKWGAMGLLIYWGYQIKPQCAICGIAAAGVEAVKLFGDFKRLIKERWKSLVRCTAAFAATVLLSAAAFSQILLPGVGVERDGDKVFGPSHFFMMGLNAGTNGTFSYDDVLLSGSAATSRERTKMNIWLALERIGDMGPQGLLNHTVKKTLVNFADGTFAWSGEGAFYDEILPPKNNLISPLLRELYYYNGRLFWIFTGIEQSVWMFTLFAPLGLLLMRKRGFDDATLVMMLSVFGLTLFEMLFEARARYLYIYAPYFVLLASAGWREVVRYVCHLRPGIAKAGIPA